MGILRFWFLIFQVNFFLLFQVKLCKYICIDWSCYYFVTFITAGYGIIFVYVLIGRIFLCPVYTVPPCHLGLSTLWTLATVFTRLLHFFLCFFFLTTYFKNLTVFFQKPWFLPALVCPHSSEAPIVSSWPIALERTPFGAALVPQHQLCFFVCSPKTVPFNSG